MLVVHDRGEKFGLLCKHSPLDVLAASVKKDCTTNQKSNTRQQKATSSKTNVSPTLVTLLPPQLDRAYLQGQQGQQGQRAPSNRIEGRLARVQRQLQGHCHAKCLGKATAKSRLQGYRDGTSLRQGLIRTFAKNELRKACCTCACAIVRMAHE
jgi:hypothetical protein